MFCKFSLIAQSLEDNFTVSVTGKISLDFKILSHGLVTLNALALS